MTDDTTAPLLAGALTEFALADVLQLLELGARSGVLAVDGGPAGRGRVVVRRGRVVGVTATGFEDVPDVADAVGALLDVPFGRWAFHTCASASPDAEPGVSIGAILVDAARRRDERARAGARAGSSYRDGDVPRATFASVSGTSPAGGLTAAHLRVLAAVDGVRDVRAIAASLRVDVARVRDAVAALRALGIVERADSAECLP